MLSIPRHSLIAAPVCGLALVLLSGCDRPPALHVAEGQAQGTSYHIKWWSENASDDQAIAGDMTATFKRIDQAISTYRDDSWLARFNQSTSTAWQQAPKSVLALLSIAREVNRQSGGCYDPTIAPLFRLWGFQTHQFHVPNDNAISNALTHTGLQHIEVNTHTGEIRKTRPDLSLDLSSMGEGYTIEQLADVLQQHGITNYLVEMGGDLFARGHKPDGSAWRVGIEKPQQGAPASQRAFDITRQDGVSLNTSGTYRRHFDEQGKTYGHIIDARTGRPVTHHLVSASVFGTRPALTDAWATTLLCLGPREGLDAANQLNMPVYLVEKQGQTPVTHESGALKSTPLVKEVTDN